MNVVNCGPNDELCAPPDVCANADESREKHLRSQVAEEDHGRVGNMLKRDKPLILAIVLMVVFLNVPYLDYILYPFMIFSTWVHETLGHGLMAFLVGGGIKKLYVYPNGSGLAYTYTSGEVWKKAFVSSWGYMGTATLGGILLLFRRTYRGPTYGTIGIGIVMLISCIFWVRNVWGAIVLPIMGIVIIICGWKLKARPVAYLFSFLAAATSFNAVMSIHDLFTPGNCYVNGEARSSDAHTVAEHWGGSYKLWASLWFVYSLIASFLGLVFVLDGTTYKEATQDQEYAYASAF